MVTGKSTVVAGATGSVGRLIVQTCLRDPRIDKVIAVVRESIPEETVGELWGSSNVSKLTQVNVDYPSLSTNDERLKEAFKGSDGYITGLGLYSGRSSEKEMDLVECEYNSILATISHEAGATRGAYLSGQGVKQPSTEGRARAMFGRAKGRAEETLAGIFKNKEEGHVSARPGAIFDRPGPPVYGPFDSMFACWPFNTLKETKFGISANDIAKGMVQGALFDNDKYGNIIWDNEQIREGARRYEKNLREAQ